MLPYLSTRIHKDKIKADYYNCSKFGAIFCPESDYLLRSQVVITNMADSSEGASLRSTLDAKFPENIGIFTFSFTLRFWFCAWICGGLLESWLVIKARHVKAEKLDSGCTRRPEHAHTNSKMSARRDSSRASERTGTADNWRPEKAKSCHLQKLRPVMVDSKLAPASRGFALQRQENVVFSPNWLAEFQPNRSFFIFCVSQLFQRCAANLVTAQYNPLFVFASALPF